MDLSKVQPVNKSIHLYNHIQERYYTHRKKACRNLRKYLYLGHSHSQLHSHLHLYMARYMGHLYRCCQNTYILQPCHTPRYCNPSFHMEYICLCLGHNRSLHRSRLLLCMVYRRGSVRIYLFLGCSSSLWSTLPHNFLHTPHKYMYRQNKGYMLLFLSKLGHCNRTP